MPVWDPSRKPSSKPSLKEEPTPAKSVATKYVAGYGPYSQRAYNDRYADRPAAYPMDALKKDSARGGTAPAPATPKAPAADKRSAKPVGLNSDAEIAAFTRGASKASPPSNKAKANGAPKLSNFGKAFKSARSSGKSEFTFGGKKYNTKLKGE